MGHHHHHAPQAAKAALSSDLERTLKRVAWASISVALILLIAKFWAWWVTDAVSLMSSLADSLFDLVVSSINFFAIRYAIKPADDDHRFGHSSIEDIMALGQFTFICGSMLFVVGQAAVTLIEGHVATAPQAGINVMIFSLILTFGLVMYQRKVFRQTGSLIVKSDSLHYLGDLLMYVSVIISLGAMKYLGIQWLDPIMAMVIALYIMKEAWEVGQRGFHNLMNREMPDSEKEKIHELLKNYPDIRGYHQLKTRYSGLKAFIQMHIELDRNLSFLQAHDIAERLEHKIETLFPNSDIMIHQDPV